MKDLYPVELENTGFYYFMAESAAMADKLIRILKDRKCSRVHRATMERVIVNSLCTLNCFRFMNLPPFEKLLLIDHGVHCEVLLIGRHVSITGYKPIDPNQANIILNAEDFREDLYKGYLIGEYRFSNPKTLELQKAVAYYRKKGML